MSLWRCQIQRAATIGLGFGFQLVIVQYSGFLIEETSHNFFLVFGVGNRLIYYGKL